MELRISPLLIKHPTFLYSSCAEGPQFVQTFNFWIRSHDAAVKSRSQCVPLPAWALSASELNVVLEADGEKLDVSVCHVPLCLISTQGTRAHPSLSLCCVLLLLCQSGKEKAENTSGQMDCLQYMVQQMKTLTFFHFVLHCLCLFEEPQYSVKHAVNIGYILQFLSGENKMVSLYSCAISLILAWPASILPCVFTAMWVFISVSLFIAAVEQLSTNCK